MPEPKAVIEPRPARVDRSEAEELSYRLRQQSAISEFGLRAAEVEDLDTLLDEAAQCCAKGMQARFCKILEYLPAEHRLFMRAGVGWAGGVVGATYLAVDTDSPAGFAFQTGRPVVSNHLATEQRFRTPRILAEHGVRRAINVLVAAGAGRPWGVLAVDSPDVGRFDAADLEFMQGLARFLGLAIAREQAKVALTQNEQFSRAVFETTPAPYLVLSPDLVIEAANDAFLHRTMSRREDLIGRPVFEVFPDRGTDGGGSGRLRSSLERVRDTGAPDKVTLLPYDIRKPSGEFEERWWEMTNWPVLGADGRVQRIIQHVEDVTAFAIERRRAAAEAADQTLFQTLLEHAPQKMWINRPDGSASRFNAAWRAYVGPPADPGSLAWLDAVHPEDREQLRRTRESAVLSQRRYAVELRLRRLSDGTYRRHLTEEAPIYENGELSAWVGVAIDVEGLRRTETDAVAEREEERLILQNATDYAVIATDLDGRITTWSPGAAAIFGYDASEVRGGTTALVYTPEDRNAGFPGRKLERARLEGAGIDHRWQLRKDGGRVFMHWSVRLLHGPGGPRGFLKIGRDETERWRAEESLRHTLEQFRVMANVLPALVFTTNASGLNTFVNDTFAAYTGRRPEELLGDGWMEVVHPDERILVAQVWRSAVETGAPYEIKLRLRRADGVYRWFLVRSVQVGDRASWFGACTDITEQVEAEQMQKMLAQEISHRVKNSLALVASLLHLQGRELDEEPRRALEEAAFRVHTVARVHDQLWRGIDAGAFDVAVFLTDLCAAIGATAPHVHTVCRVEPAYISAEHAVPLGLIVNELLTNAYKYAYPEGVGGEVRLTGAWAADGLYRVEVADHGRGLPEGFDLNRPGASLGTRVISALSRQLRARLTAENTHPGARFTLVAPLKEEPL